MAPRSAAPCRTGHGRRPTNVIAAGVILLLSACALPRVTALRDWAQSASIVVDRPALLAPTEDGPRAMQEALAIYLYALGIMADGGPLRFQAAAYAPLAPRAATTDADAGRAIEALGALLLTAQGRNPPPVEAPDGRSPVAAPPDPEDPRLQDSLRDGDAPLRVLLAALGSTMVSNGPAGIVPPGETLAPGPETAPARLAARQAADRARARVAYAAILEQIGDTHAMLRAHGFRVVYRSTSIQVGDAEARLKRAAMRLPPPAAGATTASGTLVAVLAP